VFVNKKISPKSNRVNSFSLCCQDSSQKRAVLPSLISQKLCILIKCLFAVAKFQIEEPFGTLSIFNLPETVRGMSYFVCQMCFHRSDPPISQRHHNLAPSTVFKMKGSLRLIPPTVFNFINLLMLSTHHF
jgi:hypothetical protein